MALGGRCKIKLIIIVQDSSLFAMYVYKEHMLVNQGPSNVIKYMQWLEELI
jgi:hypothetical protein